MEMKDKRPRMRGPRDDAREVAETTPGVDAVEGDEQMLLAESSEEEQTPLGEVPDVPGESEPTVSVTELQAMKADLENARKRMVREQTRATQYATKELMRRLIPVLDHFHLSVAHGEAGEGVQLALKELMDVLRYEGLEEIDVPVGTPFDPTIHHALATQPDPAVSEDTVSKVHRPGFRFKEQVLRAPEVVVAQPVDEDGPENEEDLENAAN
ncbi:MAG: nucleotide exchange factor GrpE [Actinobacteria bacterium]|nr:nucleotide exchange factor GrpE [Actinomycetota bacterium]